MRSLLGLACATATLALSAASALAGDCPGNPNALGTSRTLVVDPREHPRIGTMQYAETLPLQDHEVVLTFDDGPLPRHSNAVLDILAKECVKATFFVVGRMAKGYPEGVRKLRAAGHTIGTHSENHPLSFNRMSVEQAQQEVDEGIASVAAALGDRSAVAPFFRIPGLLRAEAVEGYLGSQGIQTWSADFPADDWRHISPEAVYGLAMSRIQAKGRGVLLLHDIQARTVAALPNILHELKARGYRIVHVVPASITLPKTPTEPSQWRLRPITEQVAISHWPKVPGFSFAHREMLPSPAVADLSLDLGGAHATFRHALRGVPVPKAAPWPRQMPAEGSTNLIAFPVPAPAVFSIPEKTQPAIRATILLPARHAANDATVAPADAMASAGPVRQISGSHAIAPAGLQRGPIGVTTRPRPLNH
ncbi:polysaccharide deacetylase family protein [Rhodopseudomonas sp. HC1]|uniref:polysaccharide deacetylase family protein n=1 Tax=Rhodopseudomonas infernalis TaxID=2897386 RepID=UPI001EE7F9A3|nr:polysaccharide deacetylase family protein [Rhodopseudomonas infernalis]MCG6206115.1 polysaccharide deacetylase family protein [Rhodopseudomonas infernalis]